MSSTLLKLCVLAVVLSVVLSSPLERERRASRFYRLAKKVTSNIKGAFSWMIPSRYRQADTVEDEAKIVLVEVDKSISEGMQLMLEGEQLKRRADELEAALGNDVGKRGDDDDDDQNGIRQFIQMLRDASQRAIDAGRKIVSNSEKISDALHDSFANISEVVIEGAADIGAAVVDFTISAVKGAQLLNHAATTANDLSNGVVDAVDALENVSRLATEASQNFQEMSSRSVTLYRRVRDVGKKLYQVIANAAKAVYRAAGFSGRR